MPHFPIPIATEILPHYRDKGVISAHILMPRGFLGLMPGLLFGRKRNKKQFRKDRRQNMANTNEENISNRPPSSSDDDDEVVPQRCQFHTTVRFKLTETCMLFLHRGDITKWVIDGQFDAIVNAANEWLLGGGGVDGAIHRAAGLDLLKACKEIPEVSPGVRCPVGIAKITRGFQLPASHIIHTVGPIYDLEENPEEKLSDAYKNSLAVARENEVKYIAFPAISCGVYGYPYEEAADVSLAAVKEASDNIKEVHFVLFEAPAWKAWAEKANQLFEKV